MQRKPGGGDGFFLSLDVLLGGQFRVQYFFQGLCRLAALEPGGGDSFLDLCPIQGQLHRTVRLQEVCQFFSGLQQVNLGLGDGRFQGFYRQVVQPGQLLPLAYLLTLFNQQRPKGSCDIKGDRFPFRKGQVAVGGYLIHDVAVLDWYQLLVFGQLCRVGLAGIGVQPIGGRRRSEQDQYQRCHLPKG